MFPSLSGSELYARTCRIYLLFLCLPSKRWHTWDKKKKKKKSFLSPPQTFSSPNFCRINYFPTIPDFVYSFLAASEGCRSANQWNKVRLRAMTAAVFVYFFVRACLMSWLRVPPSTSPAACEKGAMKLPYCPCRDLECVSDVQRCV